MYWVNTMVRKLSFIEPTPKIRAFFPAHFALIIIIVVHVVKHQSVLINTCRRQENLRMLLGSSSIINPRCACARVTVLVLSVCLCLCFPYSGTSRNQAYKKQYQRLQRDTDMKYKRDFSLKRFVPKLWRRLLTSSSSGVVSGILVPFFRRN